MIYIYIYAHHIMVGMIVLIEWLFSELYMLPFFLCLRACVCFVCLFARVYFIIGLCAVE
jgi:hypothetical protein